MASEIYCKACGKKCAGTDSYCKNCHATLKTQDHSEDLPLEGIEIEKWYKFIGKNSGGYIKDFRKHEGKNLFMSFNPGAWFFGQYWMLYRKMYLAAVITPFIANALAILLTVLSMLPSVLSSGYVDSFKVTISMNFYVYLVSFGIGIFSTSLYKTHVKKHIKSSYPDYSKGGTSLTPCLIYYVVFALIESYVISPLVFIIVMSIAN